LGVSVKEKSGFLRITTLSPKKKCFREDVDLSPLSICRGGKKDETLPQGGAAVYCRGRRERTKDRIMEICIDVNKWTRSRNEMNEKKGNRKGERPGGVTRITSVQKTPISEEGMWDPRKTMWHPPPSPLHRRKHPDCKNEKKKDPPKGGGKAGLAEDGKKEIKQKARKETTSPETSFFKPTVTEKVIRPAGIYP